MGCSKTPSEDNNEDLESYDERYNFYNFRSKRIVKNPIPPLKNDSEYKSINDNLENNKEKKEKETTNNNQEEEKNNIQTLNKDSKISNSGDLYRNNLANKNDMNNKLNVENNNKKENQNLNDSKLKNNQNDNNYDDLNDNEKKINNNKNNNGYDKNRNDKTKKKRNNNIFNEDEDYSNKDISTYKNIFSENGKTIPKYETNNKNLEEEKNEKKKDFKKSKINGITIVENLKDYFPEDITKEEIQNLVFEAFGDSIVDDTSLYIPGQTVIYEQAIELSNYIYNIIKNKKNKNVKCLEDLNVKIDLVPMNKKFIKEKMFKGQEPSDKKLENIFQSFGGESNEIKVLTIEFQ